MSVSSEESEFLKSYMLTLNKLNILEDGVNVVQDPPLRINVNRINAL